MHLAKLVLNTVWICFYRVRDMIVNTIVTKTGYFKHIFDPSDLDL